MKMAGLQQVQYERALSTKYQGCRVATEIKETDKVRGDTGEESEAFCGGFHCWS